MHVVIQECKNNTLGSNTAENLSYSLYLIINLNFCCYLLLKLPLPHRFGFFSL